MVNINTWPAESHQNWQWTQGVERPHRSLEMVRASNSRVASATALFSNVRWGPMWVKGRLILFAARSAECGSPAGILIQLSLQTARRETHPRQRFTAQPGQGAARQMRFPVTVITGFIESSFISRPCLTATARPVFRIGMQVPACKSELPNRRVVRHSGPAIRRIH